jgi:PAS domain S-box-containing protein
MTGPTPPASLLVVGLDVPATLPDGRSQVAPSLVDRVEPTESVVSALDRRGADSLVVAPDVEADHRRTVADAVRCADEQLPLLSLTDDPVSAVEETAHAEAVPPDDPERVERRLASLVADYRERRETAAASHLADCRERVLEGRWPTSSALLAALCEALVAFDEYEFAWYGQSALQAGSLEARAWAGSDALTETTFEPGLVRAGWGPSGRAAITSEPAVVHDIGGNGDFLPWLDAEPETFGIHAVAAAPITAPGAGVPFGQLAIYAGRPSAFTGRERTALESLARAVADRLTAFDRERWQVGDGVGTDHLAELVAGFPDLAVVYDDAGRYVDVLTPHQVRNFATPAELLGEHVADVLPAPAASRVLEAVQGAVESNEVRRTEYPIEVGEEPLWYEAKVAPVGLSDGRRLAVATVRETTERKATERELARQKDRIERLAGILSHDLKNHLGKASGWAELAREAGGDDLDELERVNTVLTEMRTLLDETIEMIRQSQRVLETEPVDVGTLATQCWANLPERGQLDVDPGLTPVMADPDRVRQLLENLFANVVDHAGPTASVRVGASRSGFFVADDGPGVDADDRESVFEFGYSSSADGSGFGLAIVEEIAQAHGWSTSLGESEAGGARFEFGDVEWATADATD